MRQADWDWIESQLHITLPEYYKTIITDLSDQAPDVTDYRELLTNRDDLVQVNLEVTRNFGKASSGTGFVWGPDYFVIGMDEWDDFYFIDLRQERPSILYYDHEAGESSEFMSDLTEFVEFVSELNEEEEE